MPGTRPPYPPEFRQQILDLIRAGRTPSELAEEFEPSRETIRLWVKQAELDEGERRDGLTSAEKAELTRLRKENKRLRQEREIPSLRSGQALAKAAALRQAQDGAWFARETDAVPPKSSGS